MPPPLACLFSVALSPQCRSLCPSPPTLRLVRLFQSLHGRSCLPALAPEPHGLPCTCCTSSASLSPWSVSPGQTALPASLLPSQSHLLPPAPGPTNYNDSTVAIAKKYNTFLVAVDSLLFTSPVVTSKQESGRRSGQALSLAWPTCPWPHVHLM